MKHLVQHLMATRAKQIAAKSLLNCHTPGLHSIMLIDAPEQRVRLYIATPEHQLHLNTSERPQTIAFHPHHCQLTLHCIHGSLTNIEMKIVNDVEGNDCYEFDKYRYVSEITGTGMKFQKEGSDVLKLKEAHVLYPGSTLFMKAKAIHTVYCVPGQMTAWLVYEGNEDKGYNSESWSNENLADITSEGLYIKPTVSQVTELLKQVGLL